MWKDPEAESLAGLSLWHAWRTYDGSRGVPLRRWIALCVKQHIWQEWRRVRVRFEQEPEGGIEVAEESPQDAGEYSFAFRLLVEYYLQKWPLDSIARKYQVNVATAKRLIAEAEAEFRRAMSC